ncbi:class I SAM-dependent methyltransferase [Aurantiacibacter sediminis]|uniref:Class I SAM-dependent methyltransferase n=1 Tax=Aurantiacibacter sediminis TaxID=2793064 RepID=A0ABS0N6E9_9SPHN|nr:class I SAM-dependent methyltransferase [Aurantiacibacter sediminis]MBH5323370.1 class I SAM-dependent methyltransferase [Aurantiacibacter sediminis]
MSLSPPDACRICGAAEFDAPVLAREMMFGTREEFVYARCQSCSTLQIGQVPDDLGRFYAGSAYYSFNDRRTDPAWKRWLKRMATAGMIGRPEAYPTGSGPVDRIRRGAEPWTALIGGLRKDSALLDVGCGEGTRLQALAELGFGNLTGIDPFLPDNKAGIAPSGVKLIRGDLLTHEGRYDCITMHHSLEHFADPAAMLHAARGLLVPGGKVFVRLPLFQPAIWERFGVDWAQLDAPRHLYLFSPQGFADFAASNGFECVASGFDTLGWSLAWSEAYAQGISMHDRDGQRNALPFSPRQLAEFEAEARALNADREGDQGYFVLQPA